MTNHIETTDSPDNEGGAGIGRHGRGGRPAGTDPGGGGGHHLEPQVTLTTPAELADALPYLLGHRPEDSIVLVALHDRGGHGRFGGRARLGIPADAGDWPAAARQLTQTLVRGSERRGALPEGMIVYVCQEPATGEPARQVMERLRPLAQLLRTECGKLDVPVVEALCLSGGRYWSYCCPSEECCPSDGVQMGLPGTSVLAAAAVYAGLQVRGLGELRARLLPREGEAAVAQEAALDTAEVTLVPRMLDERGRADTAEETLELAGRVMARFSTGPRPGGPAAADGRDDELLTDEEAATLILGLQDRTTRDRAAEWMEGDEAEPALRLWRALARRCVGAYAEHAAAPLTLAGWVAWSSGDELEAREALAMALCADPTYLFARLLHQACNEALDPESVRRCLRRERGRRNSAPDGDGRRSAAPWLQEPPASDHCSGPAEHRDMSAGMKDPEEARARESSEATEAIGGTEEEGIATAVLPGSWRRRCRPRGRDGAAAPRAKGVNCTGPRGVNRPGPRFPESRDGRPSVTPHRTRPQTPPRGRQRTRGDGTEEGG